MSLIAIIKIDDQCSDREINDLLAQENSDNLCLVEENTTQVEQYEFVTIFPSCLKGKEGFEGISHGLEQATGKNEVPIVDCIPRQFAIAPVHCDNCLD